MEKPHIPAIVVPAFQRPACLRLLLHSISHARFPAKSIALHFSLEGECDAEVARIAEGFDWRHGEKIIEQHPSRLGLRKHLLHCGGLSQRYGSVIVLEDDLVVGPAFYEYALEALAFSESEEKIAGCALYSYALAENCRLPFFKDCWGEDAYYMQLPCSWGQCWTQAQWTAFANWHERADDIGIERLLPDYMRGWGPQSWKKRFAAYLKASGRYFLYPSQSHTSNPGIAGMHTDAQGIFQVALSAQAQTRFLPFAQTQGAYDAYFELLPDRIQHLAPSLQGLNLAIDLYGAKPLEDIDAEWVLTTRPAEEAAQAFGMKLLPPWQNLVLGVQGREIKLVQRVNLPESKLPPRRWMQSLDGQHQAGIAALNTRLDISFSVVIPLDFGGHSVDADAIKDLAHSYPHLEILCVGSGKHELSATLLELPQCRMVHFPEAKDAEKAILHGYKQATGAWIGVLLPGQSFHESALLQLADLFLNFPEIDWLSVPSKAEWSSAKEIWRQRWDAGRYRRASDKAIQAGFQPTNIFFRKALLDGVDWQGNPGIAQLWRMFFEKSPLHTVAKAIHGTEAKAITFSTAGHEKTRLPEGQGGLRAKIAAFSHAAYRKNLPLLRQIHLATAHYPQVFRRTEDGAWFRSEY